jgi:hypothetical protein
MLSHGSSLPIIGKNGPAFMVTPSTANLEISGSRLDVGFKTVELHVSKRMCEDFRHYRTHQPSTRKRLERVIAEIPALKTAPHDFADVYDANKIAATFEDQKGRVVLVPTREKSANSCARVWMPHPPVMECPTALNGSEEVGLVGDAWRSDGDAVCDGVLDVRARLAFNEDLKSHRAASTIAFAKLRRIPDETIHLIEDTVFQSEDHKGIVHAVFVPQPIRARGSKPEARVIVRMAEHDHHVVAALRATLQASADQLRSDPSILEIAMLGDGRQT